MATLRDTQICDNGDNDSEDDDDDKNDADNDADNNDWRFSFVFDDSCCNTQV